MFHGYHWINLALGTGLLLIASNRWWTFKKQTEKGRNIGIWAGVLNITLFLSTEYKTFPYIPLLFIGANLFALAWLKMWIFKNEKYRKPALFISGICLFMCTLSLL